MKKHETELPLLIGVDAVAGLLGISQVTVWRLVSAGKMPPGMKLGGSRKWKRSDIERFVDEGCPELATGK